MKSISGAFAQLCNKKYRPLGFSKNGKTFVRLSNDVLQGFQLKFFQYEAICTVEFGIIPLCTASPDMDIGSYELDKFVVELYAQHAGWRYDPKSSESISRCVESITQTIDQYLLPLFGKCTDCGSTLPVLIELEELFDSHRQQVLLLWGDSDRAIPWQERSLADSRKYYMALKAHNFTYAQHYLNHQINAYAAKLKKMESPNSPRQPAIVKKRFVAQIDMFTKHLEQLKAGDIAYFDEWLHSSETQALEKLIAKYPNIVKHS